MNVFVQGEELDKLHARRVAAARRAEVALREAVTELQVVVEANALLALRTGRDAVRGDDRVGLWVLEQLKPLQPALSPAIPAPTYSDPVRGKSLEQLLAALAPRVAA